MLLSTLLSMKDTFIRLQKNCCTTRLVTGYALKHLYFVLLLCFISTMMLAISISLCLSYLFVSNYLLRLEMIYDLGHCYLGCIASSSLVKFNNLFHFEVLGWVSVGLPRIIRCKMLIALGTT